MKSFLFFFFSVSRGSVIDAAGMILLKTVRKILAGEKISISYGVHYKCDNILKRNRFLHKRAVECNCVHCLSNTSADEHMVYTGFD